MIWQELTKEKGTKEQHQILWLITPDDQPVIEIMARANERTLPGRIQFIRSGTQRAVCRMKYNEPAIHKKAGIMAGELYADY